MKKVIYSLLFAGLFLFTVPMHAQLNSLKKAAGNVGNTAKKAANDAVDSAKDAANEAVNTTKDVANEAVIGAKKAAYDNAANKVSDKIVKWLDENNKIAPENYTERLNSLVAKYASVDELSLNYKAYTSDEANIIACANGSIRVYTGMMDLLDDDQLLAVIANQIGHIKNKDARNSLMKVASVDNADSAAAAQLEKMLSLSGDKLGTVVNELIQIPYTDAQNTAADDYAYNLLKANDANVDGLHSALSKFAKLEDEPENIAAKYVAVNGKNSERAAAISSK